MLNTLLLKIFYSIKKYKGINFFFLNLLLGIIKIGIVKNILEKKSNFLKN